MLKTTLLNNYIELVHALSGDSQRRLLEALRGEKLRRVVEQSVNDEHLPITLTMDDLQFVVASMSDYLNLIETLEEGRRSIGDV